MYIAWDEKAVYLGLYLQDIVEDDYYRDKQVPEEDRALWKVAVGTHAREFQVRIGAGRGPVASSAEVRVVALPGTGLNVRNIAAMELPARLFGKNRFRAEDTIEFTSTTLTHARANRVDWKGRFTLLGP